MYNCDRKCKARLQCCWVWFSFTFFCLGMAHGYRRYSTPQQKSSLGKRMKRAETNHYNMNEFIVTRWISLYDVYHLRFSLSHSNHKIIQVGRDFGKSLVQPPAQSMVTQASDQVSQGFFHLRLEKLQEQWQHNLSGQPVSGLSCPHGDFFFLYQCLSCIGDVCMCKTGHYVLDMIYRCYLEGGWSLPCIFWLCSCSFNWGGCWSLCLSSAI